MGPACIFSGLGSSKVLCHFLKSTAASKCSSRFNCSTLVHVHESRDEGLNMAGLEAAIQRDLEKQKQEKKIVRELADHIATETMDWLQMRGLVLGKSE